MKNNKIITPNDVIGKYTVGQNQTIFDIAIDIHGSIDGIFDILANNDSLSFDEELAVGSEILFSNYQNENSFISDLLDARDIIPSSEVRYIYPLQPQEKHLVNVLSIKLDASIEAIELSIGVSGEAVIDWGGSEDFDFINHESVEIHKILHNSSLNTPYRVISIKSDNPFIEMSKLKINNVDIEAVYVFTEELKVGDFVIDSCGPLSIEFSKLLVSDNFVVSNANVIDLTPLIYSELNNVSILSDKIKNSVIDNFFLDIVKNNQRHGDVIMRFSVMPTGEYKEPVDKANITVPAEAMWWLVNNPEWNDIMGWTIVINGKTYKKEQ